MTKERLLSASLDLVHFFVLGLKKFSPQLLHHFINFDSELTGVHLGELLQGESPSVEAGTESDGTIVNVHTDDTHGSIVVSVGGNNNVDVLNDPLEGLVEILLLQLQLKESSVHLVHEEDGADTLGNSLSQYSLGLHAHT